MKDLLKTHLDLEPPKFDVGGNRITGEHDNDKTPDSGIDIRKFESIEDMTRYAIAEGLSRNEAFSDIGGYFCVGVGIGIILFIIGGYIVGLL